MASRLILHLNVSVPLCCLLCRAVRLPLAVALVHSGVPARRCAGQVRVQLTFGERL